MKLGDTEISLNRSYCFLYSLDYNRNYFYWLICSKYFQNSTNGIPEPDCIVL